MSHPDLLAHLLRGALPAQPGESGASDVPAVARPVEPGAGQQATQACLVHFEAVPFAPGWVLRSCETHKLTLPAKSLAEAKAERLSCEREAMKAGALSAVAGRMFHGTGR